MAVLTARAVVVTLKLNDLANGFVQGEQVCVKSESSCLNG